jgi:hypothetical protein
MRRTAAKLVLFKLAILFSAFVAVGSVVGVAISGGISNDRVLIILLLAAALMLTIVFCAPGFKSGSFRQKGAFAGAGLALCAVLLLVLQSCGHCDSEDVIGDAFLLALCVAIVAMPVLAKEA